MLCLEGVRFGAGRQMVIVDLVASALEQIERLKPVRTGMVFHHHSMKLGAFGSMGRHCLIPSIYSFAFANTSTNSLNLAR